MEELSAELESLINGEDPALDRISEDTLPSKIQSQILRLQYKMRGSEQALAKDREEIRGLIADKLTLTGGRKDQSEEKNTATWSVATAVWKTRSIISRQSQSRRKRSGF